MPECAGCHTTYIIWWQYEVVAGCIDRPCAIIDPSCLRYLHVYPYATCTLDLPSTVIIHERVNADRLCDRSGPLRSVYLMHLMHLRQHG